MYAVSIQIKGNKNYLLICVYDNIYQTINRNNQLNEKINKLKWYDKYYAWFNRHEWNRMKKYQNNNERLLQPMHEKFDNQTCLQFVKKQHALHFWNISQYCLRLQKQNRKQTQT